MTEHMKLTRERIRKLKPPAEGERTVWDTEVSGFGVRCRASGVMSYVVIFRAGGHGRDGTPRPMTLGRVNAVTLDDARTTALRIRGEVLAGRDPVAERRAAREARRQQIERERNTLAGALTLYGAHQERRGVANRANVQSALRRHLLEPVGDIPLEDLDRRKVIGASSASKPRVWPGRQSPFGDMRAPF